MLRESCSGLWAYRLKITVAILGTLGFINTLGDPLRGPGGMNGIHFTVVQTAMVLLGLPIGYWRKGSWILVCCFLAVVLLNSGTYFSLALYRSVGGAPVIAIVWWIAALLFGVGAGYLMRCRDERRANVAK